MHHPCVKTLASARSEQTSMLQAEEDACFGTPDQNHSSREREFEMLLALGSKVQACAACSDRTSICACPIMCFDLVACLHAVRSRAEFWKAYSWRTP